MIFERLKTSCVGLHIRWWFCAVLLKPMYWVDALAHVGLVVGYACDCIHMMLSIYL